MPRIPEEEIERLKRETDLAALVRAAGVELKPHGKDLVGRCPFHDDKTPSLVVTPAKGLWHCLGACNAGGSVIDWVMKTRGISFRHALEILRDERTAIAAVASTVGRGAKVGTVRHLAPPVERDADDAVLLKQVVEYYHERLKATPAALEYLEQRGLKDPEVVEVFKLGFADRTLGLRLPEKNRAAGAEIRTRLQRLGIIRESGHEHFNGSLTVPIIDEYGQVVQIYGRKINDNLRPGTPLHLYLPGAHRGVFNIQALHASDEIILCEALIDALTFWCAGFRNVTSAYGVNGFTDELFAAFQCHDIRRVFIAYDRDEAGENAAMRLAERLRTADIECLRVRFPKGMDANEYALKVTPAAQSLGVALRSAAWLGAGARRESAGARHEGAGARAPAVPDDEETRRGEVEASLAAVTPPVAPPAAMPASSLRVSSSLAAAAITEAAVAPQEVEAAPGDAEAARPGAAARQDGDVVLTFGDRRYRVRGLTRNLSPEVLRVNVLVSRADAFFVDTLDLYQARLRAAFVKLASIEIGMTEEVVKKDLGRVLLKLEELQEEEIRKATAIAVAPGVTLADAERRAALDLLQDPRLLDRILADFAACGVVGEETNKLVGYLAATSRLLDKPLAVVVQSNTAAGKSSLMEAILQLMPEEAVIKSSMLTGQSLYYMGEQDLKHKVLAIAEDGGALRAGYALKLLQSEGEVAITTVVKDAETGEHRTKSYRAEGPVMLMLTTTALSIDEELLNRCLVLTVDEDRAQTRAIHALQREAQTVEGVLAQGRKVAISRLHQNAQRLLRPLLVANPFARQLTFIDDRTRTRRDHMKYLTLIRAVALLHQHQREIKTIERDGKPIKYLEATVTDIAVANKLAHHILGRSLDELPPQTRRVLKEVVARVTAASAEKGMDRSGYRFTRRDVRAWTNLSDTQLKLHLMRLVDLEYLVVWRMRDGRFEYELLYDGGGDDGRVYLTGLIDVSALTDESALAVADPAGHDYDDARSGSDACRSGGGRPLVGGVSVGGRSAAEAGEADPAGVSGESVGGTRQLRFMEGHAPASSYAYSLSFLAAKGR